MHKIEALIEAQTVTGRPLLAEVVSQKNISIKIMIVLLILMNVLCIKK